MTWSEDPLPTGGKCWCGGKELVIRAATSSEFLCADSKFHDPRATGKPTEITKLYIAGPMTGYPECNYPTFHLAAESLRKAGFEVVNPAEVHIDERHHYVDLIREDLKVMLDCHGIATLENWWESTGARNEVQVAGMLKMPVRSLAEWLALAPNRTLRRVRRMPHA